MELVYRCLKTNWKGSWHKGGWKGFSIRVLLLCALSQSGRAGKFVSIALLMSSSWGKG